ncbi:hypothetical protein QTH91_21890 [Variovorax dokdonensis]|uniref:DUF883 domain-containing protein n=1 Tax=Variovorax dokdonensis TaxID=344883 RepID=A0ABT7NGU5_9BURK|nr:hypothetical protein [Variovorax dokdonensis]MDM0047159.1 hypothetical protein [Variovorax dokdonensis]
MNDENAPATQPETTQDDAHGKNFAQSSHDAAQDGEAGLGMLGGASIRASVRSGIREARARGEAALDDSRHFAHQAQASARSYAREAVNASGRRIRHARSRFDGQRGWNGEDFVNDQPMRAVLLAAAGGAVLTAVFIALLRGGSRR